MKNEKQALVPRLRFPEFRHAEQWRETQLGELGEFTGGGTPSKSNDSFWKGSIPWVSSSDISEDSIHEISISRFITEEALKSSATKLVPEGSILLVSRVGVGRLAITKSAVCTSQDFTNLTPCNDDLEFLGYLLKANAYALEGLGQGMAIKGFTKEDITKLSVYLPELGEQQKIADCLSSIDALIAAQADKIYALKTLKKGLMQKLFPREGETVPRLRFPEFRDAGEWRYKKAGLLFSNRTEQGQDGLPIYSVTMNDGVAKRASLDRKIDNIPESSGNKKAHKNDIIYNMMRMWQGASGVAPEHCMVSPAYVVLAPRAPICTEFFGYLFKTHQFLHILTAHSQGLTKDRLRLYFKDFAQILLPIPHVEEQRKIADSLSSLDEAITLQSEKLDVLRAHKKGLMQQLFPGPGAVGV